MNKRIVIAILIFVVVINVVFFVRTNQTTLDEKKSTLNVPQNSQNNAAQYEDDEFDDDEDTRSPFAPETNVPKTQAVSLDELALHNSLSDCWIAYNGKAYDITDYLPHHPGGQNRILPYCGSESAFEQAFTQQHGTSKVSLLMNVGVFIGDIDVVGGLA